MSSGHDAESLQRSPTPRITAVFPRNDAVTSVRHHCDRAGAAPTVPGRGRRRHRDCLMTGRAGRGDRVRIGLLMGRYAPTDKSHMPEVVRLLTGWGATAEPVHLGDELIELARIRVDYDLYVLKDKSDLAMRVAAALHAAGAALLNPYPASATLRDRIVKLRVLQAAGVPAPKTFIASHVDQLRAALEHGPLVIKPPRKLARSAPGKGIHGVRDAAELAALPPISEPVFAQRYHASDGPDRKIYSIGNEIFGVLRAWPARTHREKLGRPFTPDPEPVNITRG